jgi:hypothetical protein
MQKIKKIAAILCRVTLLEEEIKVGRCQEGNVYIETTIYFNLFSTYLT